MFLTTDDLPEVCAYFKTKTNQSEEITTMACERLMEYTAGHLLAFVKFTTHVLDPRSEIDLGNLDSYLVSEKFSNSTVYQKVLRRCFSSLTYSLKYVAENVLLNVNVRGDKDSLENNGFISPFVYARVFSKMYIPPATDAMILDESEAAVPVAEQIIIAGLRDMTDACFKSDGYLDVVDVQNALCFYWGRNVKRNLRNIWVAPQLRIIKIDQKYRGPKLAIDHIFNDHLNLGIELAVNRGAAGVREHLEGFDRHYERYKETGVVLHLQTYDYDEDFIINLVAPYDTVEAKNRIYTYSKMKNALYRGSTLVRSNVVRHLPSPTTKSYSTYAFSCMRRAVMVLK